MARGRGRPRIYPGEDRKARDAARHFAQREQRSARVAERYRTDPIYREKIIQNAKRWREANPERFAAVARAYYARRKQSNA